MTATKTFSIPLFNSSVEIASLVVRTPGSMPNFRIIGDRSIEDVKTFFKIAAAAHFNTEDAGGYALQVERIDMEGTQVARILARQDGEDGNPDAVMSLDFCMEDEDLETLEGPDEFDDAAVAQSNWDQLVDHLISWLEEFDVDFPIEPNATAEPDYGDDNEGPCEHTYEIKALYPTGGKLVQHLVCSGCDHHAARTLQEVAAGDHVVNG